MVSVDSILFIINAFITDQNNNQNNNQNTKSKPGSTSKFDSYFVVYFAFVLNGTPINLKTYSL